MAVGARQLLTLLLVHILPHTQAQDYAGTMMSMLLPKSRPSVVPQRMAVIGAGFGRTGTESLHEALEILGFKTYHMREVMKTKVHQNAWGGMCSGGATMDEVLDLVASSGYNASTDFPIAVAYEQLLARNPDSKVVLSVRDSPQVWAKSYSQTIGKMGRLSNRPPLSLGVPCVHKMQAWIVKTAGLGDESLHALANAYERWEEKVRTNVPESQLLVHNAKQGWPPLCKFLGFGDGPASETDARKLCPDARSPPIPYPHRGSSEQFMQMVAVVSFLTHNFQIIAAALLSLLAALLCGLFVLLRPSFTKQQSTETVEKNPEGSETQWSRNCDHGVDEYS